MTAREWPRATLPADRDPAFWNPMLDGIAVLYRHRKPGEQFAGLAVITTAGKRRSVLWLGRDGKVRRLALVQARDAATELECERGEEEVC